MLLNHFRPFAFAFTVFLSACQSGTSSEEYQQAFDLHEDLLAMESETRSILESVEQILARDSSMAVFAEELTTLTTELREWEARVVAVGQDEDHSEHDHAHSHEVDSELEHADLLALQKAQIGQLEQITDKVSALVEKMMDK
jgi:hypothetical protein